MSSFFCVRMMDPQKRLPSLHLWRDSKPAWIQADRDALCDPALVGGLRWMISRGLFQPLPFHHLWLKRHSSYMLHYFQAHNWNQKVLESTWTGWQVKVILYRLIRHKSWFNLICQWCWSTKHVSHRLRLAMLHMYLVTAFNNLVDR